MSFTCRYTKNNYQYVIELSPMEYNEVMEVKKDIADKKKHLTKLLDMYENLEPNRVYKTPKQIDCDKMLMP